MNLNIPDHLLDVQLISPPEEIASLSKKFGVNCAYFFDDERHPNSVRCDNNIFINTRGTYWANYMRAPWNAMTLGETILLRVLHEIGHVFHNHQGDVTLTRDGLIIKRDQDIWESNFGGSEGEAWDFAFKYRKGSSEEYVKLSNVCELWCKEHKYKNRDWVFNRDAQFYRLNGYEFSEFKEDVPNWIKDKYSYIFQ